MVPRDHGRLSKFHQDVRGSDVGEGRRALQRRQRLSRNLKDEEVGEEGQVADRGD